MPIRANRVVAITSGIFRSAVRWEMRANNPFTGVWRNRESKREVYLAPDHIACLGQVLDA